MRRSVTCGMCSSWPAAAPPSRGTCSSTGSVPSLTAGTTTARARGAPSQVWLRALFVTLTYHEPMGSERRSLVSGQGDDHKDTDGTALTKLASLSLDDLSRLDDSVVASVLEDLVRRGRCGDESSERYNQFGSAI